MSPRRTALLGFGHVAEHGHWPAWLRRDDFTVVAVADPDPARREAARRLLPDARVFDDPTAPLTQEALDAVAIATPPALHAPLAARAARAGCHVLCEKPLATTLTDARAAIDAARRAGVTLYTVHNWKYSEQFARSAALLGDGTIGRPTRLRLETIRNGRAPTIGRAWRDEAALAGGGILVDHGWHAFYLLLALAGEPPQRIGAVVERRRDATAEVEDTVSCEIEFPSLRGEIFLTWAGAGRATRWLIEGSAGRLALADDHGELVRGDERRELTFARSLSEGSHHPDWFGAVLDDFVTEIEDPAYRGRNLAEAERCLLLTSLAYESAAQGGRPLPVPPLEGGAPACGPKPSADGPSPPRRGEAAPDRDAPPRGRALPESGIR